MTTYVAVRVPEVSRFNSLFANYLRESADPESEYFVDIHLPDQRSISRAAFTGETALEYGPMTPDIIAIFIRLAGDGAVEAETIQELANSIGEEFYVVESATVLGVGLHSFVEQAIDEEVVRVVFAPRAPSDRGQFLCYETE